MYAQHFQTFVRHTNEKPVFIDELTREVHGVEAQSMLDIGAGNGSLAIPLSKLVSRYVAVETNQEHARILREAELEVIQTPFPCPIEGKFDFVLLSHVLSYQADDQRHFLESAWAKVAFGGVLLVITFKTNEENEWTRLMSRLGEERQEQYAEGYRNLLEIISSFGDYSIQRVRTEVRTATIEDIIQALAFVAGDGIPRVTDDFLAKRPLLEEILNKEYKQGNEYVFPFWHFFIRSKRYL